MATHFKPYIFESFPKQKTFRFWKLLYNVKTTQQVKALLVEKQKKVIKSSAHSMISTMEESPYGSRRLDEPEFSLREWAVKARISRENTNSRRFSASYIRSFREDTRSFRSNITISSTASSPGYNLRGTLLSASLKSQYYIHHFSSVPPHFSQMKSTRQRTHLPLPWKVTYSYVT